MKARELAFLMISLVMVMVILPVWGPHFGNPGLDKRAADSVAVVNFSWRGSSAFSGSSWQAVRSASRPFLSLGAGTQEMYLFELNSSPLYRD